MPTATDRIVAMLESVPVFGALRSDALALLLARSRSVAVARGGYFFREADAADSMFVLESGQASVIKGWQGSGVLLRHLEPGACFGEMALMDLMPRSASVRADADCRAIEFSATDLMALYDHDLEQYTLMQMNLGREVCRRLRLTDEMLFRARMGDAVGLPQALGQAA
jgi:CRP-like cAMP-binding protein